MFDALPYDVTPANAPAYSVEWRQGGATPLPGARKEDRTVTEFVSFFGDRPRVSSPAMAVTPIGGRNQSRAAVFEGQEQRPAAPDLVAKAAKDRGLLLARKYGGGVNREDASRLAILTERLRHLVPRVTVEQTDILTQMVGHLEETAGVFVAIRDRYASL